MPMRQHRLLFSNKPGHCPGCGRKMQRDEFLGCLVCWRCHICTTPTKQPDSGEV